MKSISLAILLILSTSASAETFGDDPKDAVEGSVTASYTCAGNQTGKADVDISYLLKFRTSEKTHVSSLAFGGTRTTGEDLKRINAAVRGKAIEGLAVSCSTSIRRIIFRIYDAEEAESTYLVLTKKRKDSQIEISY